MIVHNFTAIIRLTEVMIHSTLITITQTLVEVETSLCLMNNTTLKIIYNIT